MSVEYEKILRSSARHKTVVLYCDDGATTGAALRTLARAGIKNVLSLRGGLSAWKQENLPVVRG